MIEWPNLFRSDSDNRFLSKTPKRRMQYAPTACRPIGFGFVLPQVPVKPAGFHSDLWQNPKPAGFCAMSCGKVQNLPGFWCTRVGAYCIRPQMFLAKGLGLKSGGFLVYPDGKIWNPPVFSCIRVGAYCIRPKMFLAKGLGLKLGGFLVHPCRAQKHTPPNVLRQEFAAKTGRGLGVSLLGGVKSGAFLAYSGGEI